ncbi:DNA-binding protein [Lactobacillus delbrueckii subsp. delbrueckii DSM 20074 = JCM 1012]|uniref:helix-turn-helix domain-containing protein n=1 Tax=Lactobacillus delbrueckii TaxID=1584 RepID=UPI00047222CC|nr:helix-turn-helix transcriptional regulator [Lactobacillus delbrueckii]APP10177.1 transcriptional regulator [Lactobacillus delbrueckii subsp. delbrueckii DSM 20074 = JCM 1012]KNZ37663.1 DNA-binding protein [Lactobacillus delbrueckii subsp. delbrueckii]KRK25475.1 DNA-binding protein [Lactobacillus delbrueckii subsp. delbrueckii DSM 20074 = JCM 1012]MCT3493510.1 XRE family transcriptional regulator [Lactobacillus delbrueckii]MCT3521766.1 XRE family transcriptional regulator [Lactobacillus delb
MMLPSKLRDLRKKHGLSQKELAEKLMTTQAKVASWENGDSVPDISYIAKLAVLYDVSADYLLKDDKQEGQTIEPGAEMDRQNTKRLGRINSIYWTIVIAVYLLASIATGRWSTSWVLFILGGAIWLIGAGFHWINSTK